MTTRNIGGVLSAEAYALLANKHRPVDSQSLADEARRLHRTGLKPLDIAAALGVAVQVVERALLPASEPAS